MTVDEPPRERSNVSGATDGRIEYEWTAAVPASTALVEAIAAATDRDQTDLTPLYEYVDVDALDALLDVSTGDPVDVAFTYDGIRVRVSSVGRIEVGADGLD